jgi:hypothetical protein
MMAMAVVVVTHLHVVGGVSERESYLSFIF